jgi:ssDNA-binding Zn-finger/Zn-ribbon topoisomerase 1
VEGVCPKCGSGLQERTSKAKHKTFYVCDKKGKDLACDFISWDIPVENEFCETCGTYMVRKSYRGRTDDGGSEGGSEEGKKHLRCGDRDCVTNRKKGA